MARLSKKILSFDQYILVWQPKVMVVEDDPIIQETLVVILQKLGLKNILVCENALKASEAIYEHNLVGNQPISLIVLDLNMPVMNGYQFVEFHSQIPIMNEIPVIIHSTDNIFFPSIKKNKKYEMVRGYLDKNQISQKKILLTVQQALRFRINYFEKLEVITV